VLVLSQNGTAADHLLLLLLLLLLQVFYWDKATQRYKFIQDLEALNQPAGAFC
jgi:hypothetical protein